MTLVEGNSKECGCNSQGQVYQVHFYSETWSKVELGAKSRFTAARVLSHDSEPMAKIFVSTLSVTHVFENLSSVPNLECMPHTKVLQPFCLDI